MWCESQGSATVCLPFCKVMPHRMSRAWDRLTSAGPFISETSSHKELDLATSVKCRCWHSCFLGMSHLHCAPWLKALCTLPCPKCPLHREARNKKEVVEGGNRAGPPSPGSLHSLLYPFPCFLYAPTLSPRHTEFLSSKPVGSTSPCR